jgi:hypothetical protein
LFFVLEKNKKGTEVTQRNKVVSLPVGHFFEKDGRTFEKN